MIQLTALPVPGVFDPAPTAGLFTASTSDFAIALAELAGAAPVPTPTEPAPSDIVAAPGIIIAFRQASAAPGKRLPPPQGGEPEAAPLPSGRGVAPAMTLVQPRTSQEFVAAPEGQDIDKPSRDAPAEPDAAPPAASPPSSAAPILLEVPPLPAAAPGLPPRDDAIPPPPRTSAPEAAHGPRRRPTPPEPALQQSDLPSALAPAEPAPRSPTINPTSAALAPSSEGMSQPVAPAASLPILQQPQIDPQAAAPQTSQPWAAPPGLQSYLHPPFGPLWASGRDSQALAQAAAPRRSFQAAVAAHEPAPEQPRMTPRAANAPVTPPDTPPDPRVSYEARVSRANRQISDGVETLAPTGVPRPVVITPAAGPPQPLPPSSQGATRVSTASVMQAPDNLLPQTADSGTPRSTIDAGVEAAIAHVPLHGHREPLARQHATTPFPAVARGVLAPSAPLGSGAATVATATANAPLSQRSAPERSAVAATFVRSVASAPRIVRPVTQKIEVQPIASARFAAADAATIAPTSVKHEVSLTTIATAAELVATAATQPAPGGTVSGPTAELPLDPEGGPQPAQPAEVPTRSGSPPRVEQRAALPLSPSRESATPPEHFAIMSASPVRRGPVVEPPVKGPTPDRAHPTPVADATPAGAPSTLAVRTSRAAAQPSAAIATPSQPAVQAFAAAIFAAADRVTARVPESADLASAFPVSALAAAAPPIATQPAADPRAPALDLRGDSWMGEMIETIEQLRDAAGPASAGVTETRLRLAPDALGKVDVAIRQEDGQLTVQITAETAAARTILAEAAPKLAELAEARGLKLGAQGAEAGANGGLAERHQRQQQQQPNQPARPASAHRREDGPTGTLQARIA